MIETQDGLGHATKYEYDLAGRRSKVTDALSEATTFAYNDAGNQKSITDGNGVTTQFEYDANNRRTRVDYPDTTFDQTDYDELGRSIHKIDQAGKMTQFVYDALGRLTQVIDAASQRSNATTYSYDHVGNLQGYVYPNGVRTTHTYNKLNRLSDLTIDKSGTAFTRYTYTLGVAGNRTSVSELGGRQVNYTYDQLYRLTDEAIAKAISLRNKLDSVFAEKLAESLKMNHPERFFLVGLFSVLDAVFDRPLGDIVNALPLSICALHIFRV